MENIKKLTPYQHVRLRTEMYFGSRVLHTQEIINFDEDIKPSIQEVSWVPAIYTAFREILDNALDEMVAHGHGNTLRVTYDPETLTFSVEDNGRGIPIDWDEDYQMYKATLALSELMSGRNFDERGETAGVNGIGASGVNFCSESFKLEIHRDGKYFCQLFEEGNKLIDDSLVVKSPTIKNKKSNSGTKITFTLSKEVFKDRTLPESFVWSRIVEIASSNPQLNVYYNNKKIKTYPTLQKTIFDGIKPIQTYIEEDGFRSNFFILPNYVPSGDFTHSLVNNIPAFNGGAHMDMFRRHFVSSVITALERESKRRKLTPNRSDVLEGLLIYNVTFMKSPNFDSQSKTRLINEEAGKFVRDNITPETIAPILKRNSSWVDEIFQRCSERTHKKEADEVAKASKKLNRKKIPKLLDATSKERRDCVLVLAEGDSAIGGLSTVRDPKKHAGLPLRGKIMNVNGESPKRVLDSKALVDIMTAIGLNFNEKAVRSQLRYGKIYIATDADHDGANIAALLINFLYTYWPELFSDKDDPFINIFMTPFIIAEKGKDRKYWYAHNENEFDPSEYKNWTITRAKGLGTLMEEDWRKSIEDPMLYPVTDDGKIKESLDLVFNGNRSDDRKKWIGI